MHGYRAVDPARSECPGTQYYLAPDGGASTDGLTPASARRTLTGLTLAEGDRVMVLPGTYGGMQLDSSGTSRCPFGPTRRTVAL